MSPELRARVMTSVSGGARGARGERRWRPRLVASLRLLAIVVVASVVAAGLQVRAQRQRELAQGRSELLLEVQRSVSTLTDEDRKLPARVEREVQQHAAATYAGDLLPESLRAEGGLSELLSRPTLYLRGSLDVLARPGGVAEAASTSRTDAFVLCLLQPPAARSEQALRTAARVAQGRGAGMAPTAHVQRLAPVLEVLPLLSGDAQRRIAAAEHAALRDYRKLYELAPVRTALKTVKARQLLLVVDEPGDAKTPAELDGERPHAVRVTLSNLQDRTLQLRFRQQVDPSWLSAATRAEYASGVDSCGLALDLRKALGVGD